MEGFQWPTIFATYVFVAVPATVIVMVLREWRRRRAVRGRGFEVQPPVPPRPS